MEDISNYEKLKADSQRFYHSKKSIFCPALNQEVNFTSEGFNHLVFKNARSERERPSQILRFKLLPIAIELLGISTTFQEFEETLKEFLVMDHKKKVMKSKVVKYWGIIAILRGRKVKVIVRKVGDNGLMHFWSVVPAWATSKQRDQKFYSTMKGNPDED